ncbi:ABC transporter permease [Proteinivorax tanatarense]|uniref:ABC transporter permease n=1 Tax=Proteinivorax tanatarense TaxID=1260629 RepID=A0AAU7VPR5_9FIRM
MKIKDSNFIWKVMNNIGLFLLLIVLSFVLPRLLPGSPILSFQEDIHVLNSTLTEETFNRFEDYYAPNEPLWKQFRIYVTSLIRLDLGYSFYYGYPVMDIILGRIGWTLFLSLTSICISFIIAIPIGIYSAMNSDKKEDRLIMGGALFLQSIPIFIIALIIQRIFAYNLGWFPSQGAYDIGVYSSSIEFLKDAGYYMILPLIASTIGLFPSNYILTRNIIIKTKNEPYVQMAHFNNLDRPIIKYHYIFRNALPEIISKLNINVVYAIGGTLFVEMIFSYPGLGMLLKEAVASRDYPLIQGIFIITSIYAIFVNIFFEWLLYKVSPRVSK